MLLQGKNVLIYGVRNERSIAWGCAQSMAREGARLALAYLGEREEKDVRKLAATLPNPDSVVLASCDLGDDSQIAALHDTLAKEFGRLDAIVHGVAFGKKEDLSGAFVDTSRDGFLLAMNISVFTLVAAAKAALPLMTEGGSILTLTYLGGERVVPNYNVMGVAKAALESAVRYLAVDLGPKNVRVNAISAGATMTLSARGIAGFTDMFKNARDVSPIPGNTTIDQIGDMAAFLSSEYARGTTAEVVYVDNGMHCLAKV